MRQIEKLLGQLAQCLEPFQFPLMGCHGVSIVVAVIAYVAMLLVGHTYIVGVPLLSGVPLFS